MQFEQFFTMTGVGAMVLIVGVLGWTVREVVRLSGVNTRLETLMATLEARMTKAENKVVGVDDVRGKLGILEERTVHITETLREIKEALVPGKPAPRRRTTGG